MKRVFLTLGFSLLLAAFTPGQLKDDSCGVYSGTMGESTGVGMMLYAKGKALDGAYFYHKYLRDIPLKGNATGDRDLSLQEADAGGAVKGTFHLHLAEHDPQYSSTEVLLGEVLKGTWTSADSAKTYPVALRWQHECARPGGREYEVAGANDDAVVEKNAQAFYNAVLGAKREEAAKYVSYPCTFFRDGKRVTVKNSAEFLQNYDAIFTKGFVAKIASGVPHHMFANYQGIMIADGAVWFDENGEARNFNNSPTS
jgi:hypothetical protein